jgi:hypothetical protein
MKQPKTRLTQKSWHWTMSTGKQEHNDGSIKTKSYLTEDDG